MDASIQGMLQHVSKTLQTAVQADEWGQVVEAIESYELCADEAEHLAEISTWPIWETAFARKLGCMVQLRKLLRTATGNSDGPSLDEMKKLCKVVRRWAAQPHPYYTRFPFKMSKWEISSSSLQLPSDEELDELVQASQAETDDAIEPPTALPAVVASTSNINNSAQTHRNRRTEDNRAEVYVPEAEWDASEALLREHLNHLPGSAEPGEQYLIIDIDRIGLKDAEMYQEPFIAVSVYDANGRLIEPTQETKLPENKMRTHVVFNSRIYIQTPMRELAVGDCAVFFEFKHFKRKKKYFSVRCWSFLEMDEISKDTNPTALEIYKKPTDVMRKKLYWHSKKDLYLHLTTHLFTVPSPLQ